MSHRDRDGAPHPVDVQVGARVRWARQQAGLSLATLAARVGVAFQQLQKYEAGANRISASMLYELAVALKVPVATFFEGPGALPGGPPVSGERAARLQDILSCAERAQLLDAFLALPRAAQVHLLGLARALAPTDPDSRWLRSTG